MNNFNDILTFLRGGQPNYGAAMSDIQSLINAKLQRMRPQTSYFGANRLPVAGDQAVSIFTNPMGYSSYGQPR